jgi:Ca2+-binding EF-hand superfamily protein
MFDLFDVNGNSYVEKGDIDALATRLTTAFADAPADRIAQVQAAYTDLWRNLAAAADTSDDGRVSRHEFVTAFTTLAEGGEESFDTAIRSVPHAVFRLCDRDGDGRITATEFRLFHQALGTGDPDAARALAALDLDHDGVLTFDELMTAAKEFVLSHDADTPGNWLFGGVEQ